MRIFSCSFSPKEPIVSISYENGTIELWNAEDKIKHKQVEDTHGKEECLRTNWNSEGSLLISGGGDGNIVLWNSELEQKGKLRLNIVDEEDQAIYACWFQTSNQITCAFDDIISSFDYENDKLLWTYQFENSDKVKGPRNRKGKRYVFDACPGRKLVAAALSDGSLQFYDPISGVISASLNAHEKTCTSCRFSPSENSITSTSSDGFATVWDVRNWKPIFETPNHSSIVYGVQYLNGSDDIFLTWAKDLLYFWKDYQLHTQAKLDTPILCADEKFGTLVCGGELSDCSHGCEHDSHDHNHHKKTKHQNKVNGITFMKTNCLLELT